MTASSEPYLAQVQLLLQVLPHVAAQEQFALKGGTAINFFYRNAPRLSVDIDLHYLPNDNRDTALADIHGAMDEIGQALTRALPGNWYFKHPRTGNSQITYNGAAVKLEPNNVIRGPLLPVQSRPLCERMSNAFNTRPRVACLARAELFAGKLCAALQRQHPRDLYDVYLLLEEEDGLSHDLMDAFVVYATSQGKPIAELLDPNIQPIDHIYANQFAGMAAQAIELEQLKTVQAALPALVRDKLTAEHRQFLVSFKRGNPDWSLIRHSHAQELPAVRWKQFNLQRMVDANRAKAADKLEKLLLK